MKSYQNTLLSYYLYLGIRTIFFDNFSEIYETTAKNSPFFQIIKKNKSDV